MFFTGFLSAVRQPLRFQPWIQPVTPPRTYCESVWRSTSLDCFSASSAMMAAVSSIRLLVVAAAPPDSSFSWPRPRRMAPQPPGPGLPEQAPSVQIVIVSVIDTRRLRPR